MADSQAPTPSPQPTVINRAASAGGNMAIGSGSTLSLQPIIKFIFQCLVAKGLVMPSDEATQAMGAGVILVIAGVAAIRWSKPRVRRDR